MSGLSFNSIGTLIPVSVFVAGFLASPHCAFMCGPLVLTFSRKKFEMVCYQAGRVFAYTLAGAALGAFGPPSLINSQFSNLSSLSIFILAALLMFAAYRTFRGQSMHLPLPRFLSQQSQKLLIALSNSKLPRSLIAYFAGSLSLFLPCAHLYTFLIGAAATGSAFAGGAFMFFFGLSTVPALTLSSGIIGRILRPSAQRYPRVAGCLLLIAGFISLIVFAAQNPLVQCQWPIK